MEFCSTPFNGRAKPLDNGRKWTTLTYTDPECSKCVHCVSCLASMLAMQKLWFFCSLQEFCTDPCNMGPSCIIMLQHEVMVIYQYKTIGLRISSWCAFKINKMHLCPEDMTAHTLSTYDIIHNVSPQPCIVKIVMEENISQKCETPSNLSESGRDTDDDNEHANETPWDGFLICNTCEMDGFSWQRRAP